MGGPVLPATCVDIAGNDRRGACRFLAPEMDAEISARHRVWRQVQISITLLKHLARWSGASIARDAVGKISLPNAPLPIAPQRRQPVTAAAMGQRPLNVSPR